MNNDLKHRIAAFLCDNTHHTAGKSCDLADFIVAMIEAERAPVASLIPTEQPTYWMVEAVVSPMWWDGRFLSRGIDPRHFTTDPNLAVKFASKADAERVVDHSSSLKATEHIWLATPTPAVIARPAEEIITAEFFRALAEFEKAPSLTARLKLADHVESLVMRRFGAPASQQESTPPGWQPIETAPLDSTRVVLFYPVPVFTGIHTIYGNRNPDTYAKNPKPYWQHDLSNLSGITGCRGNAPTHWMPALAGPAEQTNLPAGTAGFSPAESEDPIGDFQRDARQAKLDDFVASLPVAAEMRPDMSTLHRWEMYEGEMTKIPLGAHNGDDTEFIKAADVERLLAPTPAPTGDTK